MTDNWSEIYYDISCIALGVNFIFCMKFKGSSQHKVGGEWFEIKLGKISRMLVKYEVLPIPNVIFVC